MEAVVGSSVPIQWRTLAVKNSHPDYKLERPGCVRISFLWQKGVLPPARQALRWAEDVSNFRRPSCPPLRAILEDSALGEVPDATGNSELEEMCINTIRMLTVDSVNKAKAGHPGAAMGLAPLGYLLFSEIMRFNPSNPSWFNRDRFVMSNGHAALLQYTLLHLTGYDLQVSDLQNLVQLGSKTPGHPENSVTSGIEVVTGPLGQGFAQSVGLALAECHLAARFGSSVVDHYTYVIFGDGCAMEGVTNEAASLAGHWGLHKLVAFYDSNRVTIDGSSDISLTEDVGLRFQALGWFVQTVPIGDYGNLADLREAISEARAQTERPSLIVMQTVIGFGSPSREGTSKAHHGAFGEEETAQIGRKLQWPWQEPFFVPAQVARVMHKASDRGREAEARWAEEAWRKYKGTNPDDAEALQNIMEGNLPPGWEDSLPTWTPEDSPDASRGYSETCLNRLATVLPGLLGGSADLEGSNKSHVKQWEYFQRSTPWGRNVRFGVREHAMAAICNGVSLHSPGLRPFAATFLVFSDYMRPAVRLAALSHARTLFIFTHDSIGLGEDGPTHQPVEHLASLRAMPNLLVFRPGDGNETAGAYLAALRRNDGPSAIVLSRQKVDAHLRGSNREGVMRGAYVLTDNAKGNEGRAGDGEGGESLPDLIIMGTGSELVLCERAAEQLREEVEGGLRVRVVSLVCWELFQQQTLLYQEQVLPPCCTARLSVEAGSQQGWQEWVGPHGVSIAVSNFGKSGSYLQVFAAFGFTVSNVVHHAKLVMKKQQNLLQQHG